MKIKERKTQKSLSKKPLEFQDYKNRLEVAQIGNKINYSEKTEIDVEAIEENKKES